MIPWKLWCALLTLALLTGCGSLQTAAPNALERSAYNIQTNYTPQVVQVTNWAFVTNFQVEAYTNTIAGMPVLIFVTNTVPVQVPGPVQFVTNMVPSYTFTPSAAASNTTNAIGMGINAFVPGVGTIVSAVLTGLLGLWGAVRTKQKNVATQIAANGVQAIEAARNIMGALPNGPQLLTAYDAFLKAHQADANIAEEVATLVDQVVNTVSGQAAGTGAATQILQAALGTGAPAVKT